MQTIIRTQYVNVNGAGKVKATGLGKQRTTPLDLSKSNDWNHGNAAGVLALALGLDWHDGIGHDQSDDGQKHGFSF